MRSIARRTTADKRRGGGGCWLIGHGTNGRTMRSPGNVKWATPWSICYDPYWKPLPVRNPPPGLPDSSYGWTNTDARVARFHGLVGRNHTLGDAETKELHRVHMGGPEQGSDAERSAEDAGVSGGTHRSPLRVISR